MNPNSSPLIGDKHVNWKAVLILLGSLVALVAVVFFVHGFQVDRNAVVLLAEADAAEKNNDPRSAIIHLQEYLGLNGRDTEVLARYGMLLVKEAKDPRGRARAALVLEKVLQQDSGRDDVRLELTRIRVEQRNFPEAKELLAALYKGGTSTDPEVQLLSARTMSGQHEYTEAGKWYAQAIAQAPKNTAPAVEYAFLLRERLNDEARADDVVEKLLAAAPESQEARLMAARYYTRFGSRDKAWEQVSYALDKLGPPSSDLLLVASDLAVEKGDSKKARAILENGRSLYPSQGAFARAQARLDLREGDRKQALADLKDFIENPKAPPEELFEMANLLIDAGATAEAQKMTERMEEKASPSAYHLLRGRLLMQKEKWGEASKELERAASESPGSFLGKNIQFFLGQCYGRLGNPDQQIQSYRRALEIEPNWLAARRGLVSAEAAAGQIDQAIADANKLGNDGRLELLQLLTARTQRMPEGSRDWTDVNNLLTDLKKQKQTSQSQFLIAETLIAQDKLDEARSVVEAERDRDPKSVTPYLFLIGLANRTGKTSSIPSIIDQAEKAVGPRADWILTRARYWVTKGQADAEKNLPGLLGQIDKLDEKERERAYQGLGEALAIVGDKAGARKLWQSIAAKEPDNLGVQYALLENAAQSKDLEAAQEVVKQLRRIEGGEGVLTCYGEALARILRYERGDKEVIEEARDYLAKAAGLRPSWSRVPLLEATLFDMEGDTEAAVNKYQAAIELGESRPQIVQRAMILLYTTRQYARADAILRKMPEQARNRPELAKLVTQLEIINNPGEGQDPETARKHALEQARKAVAQSRDAKDFLWLGQIAAVAGQVDEAEKALRRATEIDPKAPQGWSSLMFLLARNGKPKEAEAVLAEAEKNIPAEQAALVLAAGHEALGHVQKAEEYYQSALKARPKDVAVLRDASSFYSRTGQPTKSQKLLEVLLDPETKAPETTTRWAKRTLALAVAAQGGYPKLQQAETMLREASKGRETPEDKIAMAVIKASHPSTRKEAIRMCESLIANNRSGTPDEVRVLLAQLYEQLGDWVNAEAHLRELLQLHEKSPAYLSRYIRVLLGQKRSEDAEPYTKKYMEVAPKSVDALELRVVTLKNLNKDKQAVELVRSYAGQPEARPEVVAAWMERLDQPKEAEVYLRKYVDKAPQPEAVLALARFLGRHDRTVDALAICDKAWKKCRPEAVGATCLELARSDKMTPDQRKRIEGALAVAIRERPNSQPLQVFLAQFYEKEHRFKEAMEIYKAVIEQDGKNIIALNNLAYLIALSDGNAGEALGLVSKAIEQAGPIDELLDTRAVAYLRNNDTDKAVRDLEQAIAQQPAADRLFHLAKAYDQRGQRREAAEAFRRARALGLDESKLHQLELETYRKMLEDFR